MQGKQDDEDDEFANGFHFCKKARIKRELSIPYNSQR